MLVFMDICMPLMGGIEATKIIKEYLKENRLDTIILGLIGDTDEDISVRCEEVGMAEIRKSIDIDINSRKAIEI